MPVSIHQLVGLALTCFVVVGTATCTDAEEGCSKDLPRQGTIALQSKHAIHLAKAKQHKPEGKKWNYLFITQDEERDITHYESTDESFGDVKNFLEAMPARKALKEHGLDFRHHYIASAACAPSRASMFTGHYPSLHGMGQVDGAAKNEHQVYFLHPEQMPTMGHYLRAHGYRTYLRGKCHFAHRNLEYGSWDDHIMASDDNGHPIESMRRLYDAANLLDPYGFTGVQGPEPHGALRSQTGVAVDPLYANETIALLRELEKEYNENPNEFKPFLVVANFMNPHDIAIGGLMAKVLFLKNPIVPSEDEGFTEDQAPSSVPAAPTSFQSFDGRPQAHQSYGDAYGTFFPGQPAAESEYFRQCYYYWLKLCDMEIAKILDELKQGPFYNDTIVIYTSDHGDYLGAHGNLKQKWYTMYEETVRVPFIVSNPVLFPTAMTTNVLSSHVDIIPTLLGLSGLSEEAAQQSRAWTMAKPLVGKDLSDVIYGKSKGEEPSGPNKAVYFMTDDDVLKARGQNPGPVLEPNNLDAMIKQDGDSLVKVAFYFNGDLFGTDDSEAETNSSMIDDLMEIVLQGNDETCESTYSMACSDLGEFEMYDLSTDPLEEHNLAASDDPRLNGLLRELSSLRAKTRLSPPDYPTENIEETEETETVRNPFRRFSVG